MPKFIVKPDSSNTYLIRYVASGFQTIHGKSPYPNEETGTWFHFDDETNEYVDSGYKIKYEDEWIVNAIESLNSAVSRIIDYIENENQDATGGGEKVDGQ